MKRWLVNLTLVGYLSAFAGGLVVHAMSLPATYNPAVYFFVWDMFCGWANYERRQYVIAEGVSGRFYEVSPAPWGELEPFGTIGRTHYDSSGAYALKFGLNILKKTQHEEMSRVFVVEQFYAKKYNLSDNLWNRYFNEPKNPTYYHNTLYVVLPDGTPIEVRTGWLADQHSRVLAANPKVIEESHKSQPFLAVERPASAGPQAYPFMDPVMSRAALGQ